MNTQEFIKKMSEDEALAKKMEGCKSPEEAYTVAEGVGLTDDIETFKAVMTALNKQINDELSDDELENVVGGMSTGEAIGWGWFGGCCALGCAASAAAA